MNRLYEVDLQWPDTMNRNDEPSAFIPFDAYLTHAQHESSEEKKLKPIFSKWNNIKTHQSCALFVLKIFSKMFVFESNVMYVSGNHIFGQNECSWFYILNCQIVGKML